MADYVTFDVVNKETNELILKYLYNIACTSQTDEEEFITYGITIVTHDMGNTHNYIIKPKIRSFRELFYDLKHYKFINPDERRAPFFPNIVSPY